MESWSVVMGHQKKARWVMAHEELCELSRRRGELEWPEGAALLRALRANVHRHLGFGSFAEYVERLFGYGRRAVDDKVRTALALEELPMLSQALREGGLTASAVREVSRVATIETEREWLEATRGRTVHQIERMVSGRSRGDRPTDPANSSERRHVLRFEVNAETLAHVREAFAELRRRSAEPLDDDAVLLLMTREVLAGPTDEGRASYQVAITRCDECGRGFQEAAGELIQVDEVAMSMAACDAQELGCVEASPLQATHVGHEQRATQSIPPASPQGDAPRPRLLRRARLPSPSLRRLASPRTACRGRNARREQFGRIVFRAPSGGAPPATDYPRKSRDRALASPCRWHELR